MQAAPGTPLSQAGADVSTGAGAHGSAPPRRRRVAVLACVAAFALAADIVSKAIVVAHLRPDQPVHVLGDIFEFLLTRNPGAAFSVGTGETAVFTVIAFGVIVYIARTARKLYSVGWAIALGLLLGGAMGNLGDRIFRSPGPFRGYVVDWIGVVPRYYPIFNLADSAIVCGGILTVILALRGHHLDGTRSVDDARADETGAEESGELSAERGTPQTPEDATEPADPARPADSTGPAEPTRPAEP
ncbi:MAG TPA: signal peptidase II [Trebonia sp.]